MAAKKKAAEKKPERMILPTMADVQAQADAFCRDRGAQVKWNAKPERDGWKPAPSKDGQLVCEQDGRPLYLVWRAS